MNDFTLEIAGYRIRFLTVGPGEKMTLPDIYAGFRSNSRKHNLIVRVHRHHPETAGQPRVLFKAGYYEESGNSPVQLSEDFWEVTDYNGKRFVEAWVPYRDSQRRVWLKFDLESTIWDLYLNTETAVLNPLFYPIDSLLLYYLVTRGHGILIHASGLHYRNRGYLFTGPSGSGKTTMARWWSGQGAEVIHDDRLVIRQGRRGFKIYNTPVYPGDHSRCCPLRAVYMIEHARENRLEALSGAAAVGSLIANCIQHSYDSRLIDVLLDAASSVCSSLPTYRLGFTPGSEIIDFITGHE